VARKLQPGGGFFPLSRTAAFSCPKGWLRSDFPAFFHSPIGSFPFGRSRWENFSGTAAERRGAKSAQYQKKGRSIREMKENGAAPGEKLREFCCHKGL
jgi:hypothetical protein